MHELQIKDSFKYDRYQFKSLVIGDRFVVTPKSNMIFIKEQTQYVPTDIEDLAEVNLRSETTNQLYYISPNDYVYKLIPSCSLIL